MNRFEATVSDVLDELKVQEIEKAIKRMLKRRKLNIENITCVTW